MLLKAVFCCVLPLAASKIALAATLAALLLHSAFAQQQPATTPAAPVITAVTPGNSQAVISFAEPRSTGNPIREYVVSCETVGNPAAGIIEGKF